MANEPGANAPTRPSSSSATGTAAAAAAAGAPSQRAESGARNSAAAANSAAEGPSLTPLESFKIKCLNSALYHDDREKFLARINRLLMFVVVVFGASALAPIRDKYYWIPVITAFAGLANLVFDVNGAARVHSSLRQKLYGILADAEVNSDVASLERRLILVYADEPPLMYAVSAVAYNNAMLSYGRTQTDNLMKVGFFARFFRHWIPFAANSFHTYGERKVQRG